MTSVITKRVVRAFIAAALAGIAAQLASGVTINSVEDLKKLGISLLVAAITAGLMGIDKLIRFDELPATGSQG